MRTLINTNGEELLNIMSSSSKPLAQLFKRLVSVHRLKEEPVAVCAYNDLVLCCATRSYQRDYYICNPYTIQWVPRPPPPQVYIYVPVGLICDLPYYGHEKDDEKEDNLQLNADYRCKVVRIIFPDDDEFCKFKVQVFSSETGEWRESIVLSPSSITYREILLGVGYAFKKLLYWVSEGGDCLIGLDPLKINSSNSSNLSSTDSTSTSSTKGDDISDHYTCHFVEYNEPDHIALEILGVYRGCLRLCETDYFAHTLGYYEMIGEGEREGRLVLKSWFKRYTLDKEKIPPDPERVNLYFDPNNEDILYMLVEERDIIGWNVRTEEVVQMGRKRLQCHYFFPLVLPWWPTPVPRLPHVQPHF